MGLAKCIVTMPALIAAREAEFPGLATSWNRHLPATRLDLNRNVQGSPLEFASGHRIGDREIHPFDLDPDQPAQRAHVNGGVGCGAFEQGPIEFKNQPVLAKTDNHPFDTRLI